MKKGSSETTREAPDFNFSLYNKAKPSHIKKIDTQFLEWFIGFVEGDGSFIVGTTTGKKRKTIFFCINQKDDKLMYKIKKKLGFGVVNSFIQNNQTYYRYAVYDFDGIRRLLCLFNGNLLLNKVNTRFQIWLNEYNTTYGKLYSNHTMIFYKTCESILSLNSAWLSGFTDAEGGFYASLTKQENLKLNYRLRLKFYITQKYELEILKDISKLIHENSEESNFTVFNENRHIATLKPDIYRLELTSNQCISNIIRYFEKYQLQGKTHITFNRWKRIYFEKDKLKKAAFVSEKAFTRFKRLVSSVQNN